jgi:hypothetical protein
MKIHICLPLTGFMNLASLIILLREGRKCSLKSWMNFQLVVLGQFAVLPVKKIALSF